MNSLTIEDKKVSAVSPEGVPATMPLEAFLESLSPRAAGSSETILPDGIKAVTARGRTEIWIHQIPPRAHSFKWIAEDSKIRFGKGAKYRTVRIALPYLVTFAVFVPGPGGKPTLSGNNECFFAKEPLDWATELFYPALLNCSKFDPQEGHPLAWICSQYLPRSFDAEPDVSKRMRAALMELLRCLLDTGFNYSSEHHEGDSWFSASRDADPRIESVEAWEKASREDELFVLDVPWKSTGKNTRQVLDRIFDLHQAKAPKWESASDLARIVFNHQANPVAKAAGDFNPFSEEVV